MSRFIDKRLCKSIFGIPNDYKMSTDELHRRTRFVTGVMMGSDYECKCYSRDYCPFNDTFHPNWEKLYTRYTKQLGPTKEWPVFGEQEGYVVFYIRNLESSIEPLTDWAVPT